MATTRLDSDERRQQIVDAAVPLFARKGFAGTTTRELAEAAGISEALLFRHFPSKELLYRELLQQLGCQGDPALEQLAALPACTATLVGMVRFMVWRFVAGSDADRADLDPRLRLVLHSCLEDGDYARELFEAVAARVAPYFAASLDAAVKAGDAVPPPATRRSGWPTNHFWFGHHIAAMIAIAALPGRSCVPYAGDPETLVDEASRFILRGIGMSDAAITAHTARSSGAGGLKTAAD
jgi:TetR/AcrR family transcriptional regulator, transcriptional repressor of aconitase